MANMSMAMQMATQQQGSPAPAGGLQQAGGGNPLGMAKQATDASLMQQNTEELTIPSLMGAASAGEREYIRRLNEALAEGLPSQAEIRRARMQQAAQQQRALQALSPTEYDPMDMIARGITGALGNNPALMQRGNLGAALAGMGSGVSAQRQAFEDREIAKSGQALELAERERTAQDKMITDSMSRRRASSGQPEFVLPDGTPVYKSGTRMVYIGADGKPVEWLGAEKTVLGADTLYGKRVQLIDSLAKQWLDRGDYRTLEEATGAAEREVNRLLSGADRRTGMEPRPTTPAAGTPPVTAEPVRRTPAPVDFPKVSSQEQGARDADAYLILRQEIAAASKEGRANDLAALQREMSLRFPQGAPKTSPSTAPTAGGTPKKSARREEFQSAYGSKEGAALQKTHEAAFDTYRSNASLIGTLNTLEGLFSSPNMPEGEFAKGFTAVQSGLKSLGVDVGDAVGPSQAAIALSNEMALKLRTGGGDNLMPGQMSNYDAQLLQSMAPNLSQTHQGRMMLTSLMKDMAESKMRIAKAAQDFARENNNQLTPEWYTRAQQLERQEMARRELRRREIMKQFGGK